MRHIEFTHNDHFEQHYHRVPPPSGLAQFIDFFWETRFEELWKEYPRGFSDAQFPNIGYTYIINLGTPFVMQVTDRKFHMKTDGYLPRHNAIECFHKPGNHLFGIKFRISPVILEKKINFSEYQGYIFPLSYLLDQEVIDQVKRATSFEERIAILSKYFLSLVAKQERITPAVAIVSEILDQSFQSNSFDEPVGQLAEKYSVSVRTLQRHFETCTGIGTKQALQVMRIRKAAAHLYHSPGDFRLEDYGYYDLSHFQKHLRQFSGGAIRYQLGEVKKAEKKNAGH